MSVSTKPTRYIPLFDEIKNHVFQWAVDADWKTLPRAVNTALTTVMNELKIAEELSKIGGIDERDSIDPKKDKKAFFALFKRKYVETCDMSYNDPMDVVTQVNIARVIETIHKEGGNYVEFIEWFFDDWLSLEQNKKYIPPSVNLMCKNFVVTKYLYEMKDTLKMRKREMDEQGVRNMLLEIALSMAKRTGSKEFSEKILDFNNQRISATKFFEQMKIFADKLNDKEAKEACAKIDIQKKQ